MFPLERADAVRTFLGANTSFCRSVFECLIEQKHRGNQTGKLVDYVLDKMSWTGMSAYKWVYECLMQTDSPVFVHETVKAKTLALVEVVEFLAKSQYPHFFMYFGSPKEVSKLMKSRFPIILSLA